MVVEHAAPPVKRRRHRGILRFIKRVVVGLLGVVIVTLAIGLITVHTDWGRDKIRGQIEAALRDVFPGGATVGKVEGSVFGELVVREVVINGMDRGPMVSVATLRVEVSLWQLVSREVHVDHLVAEGVTVALREQPPDPPKPPSTGDGSWSVALPDVRVVNATVSIEGGPEPIHVDQVVVAATAVMASGQPIVATVTTSGWWRERSAAFGVVASAIVTDGVVTIPSASVLVGGAIIAVKNLVADPVAPVGTITAVAPAIAVGRLAPGLVIPADAVVTLELASIRGPADQSGKTINNLLGVAVTGTFGDARVQAWLRGDPKARAASGLVIGTVPTLAPLTRGKLVGAGDAAIAFTTDGITVRGIVLANETIDKLPAARAFVALDGTRSRASTVVVVAAAGGLRSIVTSELHRTAEAITLTRADVVASVTDPEEASLGRVPATGTLHAHAAVKNGRLWPVLDVAVTGTTSGADLTYKATRIAGLDGRFSARIAGAVPLGSAHVELRGVSQAGKPFGSASIDATNRADKTIAVVVQARPRPDTVIDLDAIVTPGETIAVELGQHRITMASASRSDPREFTGSGGHVVIEPTLVVASGISTSHRGGKVELSATFDRVTEALAAEVKVATLPVALLDPRAQGTASGKLAIARRGGRWSGEGTLAAAGVVIDERITVDGDVRLKLDGRRVSLGANTTLDPTIIETFTLSALHGSAEVALEIDGPRDVMDVAGWQSLTRKDLRAASLTLNTIDLGLLGASGSIDGTIILTPTDTHGSIEISGVQTPAGTANGIVALDNANGEVTARTEAKVEGVGIAKIEARLVLPDRLFDPVAWQLLGKDAVREVTARFDDITVDPELLARFKIIAPYRGHAQVALAIGPGISSAKFTLDADNLRGGPVIKPLDLHAVAEMDGEGSTAKLDVYVSGQSPRANGGAPKGAYDRGKVFHIDGQIPVTFERWRTGGYAIARVASLEGTMTIPPTKVADVLAIFGRRDVAEGIIDGTGTLRGTLGVPIGIASIAAHGVKVPPLITGKLAPILDELKIAATWGGVAGSIEVIGAESDGGGLRITANGRPDELAAARGTIDITSFDIAPIAAFLPGALVSTSGKVDAHIDVRGFAPESAHVRGKLVLSKGRLPLSPLIGTLRDTTATLELTDRAAGLEVRGKLGACNVGEANRCRTVYLKANGDPDDITAKMTLDHVQPITALQPEITAEITAKLHREPEHWGGRVDVFHAVVKIPQQTGSELLASTAPSDMVFVDSITPIIKGGVRPPPVRPWVVADVAIASTRIDADELRGSARGALQISIGGDSIGMLGTIEAEQGVADVFGHRYQVDHGNVTFDGTTDAQLDIRLIHDFAAVTLIADVGNRLSNPELALSSEPAMFTEGQLLGFFLGGTPGGDPNSQTRDAAAGAGTSLLSQKIGRAANKVLPVQIDVFNCSVSTATTSAACTVGKWFSQKLFIAYKQHLEARPEENTNEGQVEYYLRHDVLIEGSIGNRDHDGVDLLWRHRW